MSQVVLDASVLVKLVAEEPGSAAAADVYSAADRVVIPGWARVECSQALWKKVRRGEWSALDARRALQALDRAALEVIDAGAAVPEALDLACALGHPVYDCLHLAVAASEGAPLVTADKKLAEIARGVLGDAVVEIDASSG